jgi:hypothetical protein
MGSANIPTPPVREARVHRLFATALTLLFVCFASSIAHAQSCTTNSNGRITLIPSANNPFPFDPGVNNPFPPGSSGPGPTHFSFNGLPGDTFNFQANPVNPGPPGTSQIALLSAANHSITLATIPLSTTASYVLTAANIAASPFVMQFTNNGPNTLSYMVNCIPVGSPSPLVAAVLPESRSVQVNGTATAFATIINSSTSTAATNCSIAPASGLPVTFAYQTTNPSTNAVTGTRNTPVNIPANNGSQSFVIALTPTAPIAPTDVNFNFSCTDTNPAPVVSGLNTLLFSASTTPTPDVVALAATLQNDGIVHVTTGSPMTGVFAVATVNLGSTDTITASTNTGPATLPITVNICQTNPTSGACLQTPGPTAATTITANAEPTFGIFVTANGTVPPDFANSRIFVQFTDSTGAVRGETSVAVETQ